MPRRLTAPKILQVHKVANFLGGKLVDLGIAAQPLPVYYTLTSDDQQAGSASAGYTNYNQPAPLPPAGNALMTGQPVLELMCCGYAVPYNLTLAAVKKFIWRRSDDVIVHYRIQDPLRPAPMPTIKPPDS